MTYPIPPTLMLGHTGRGGLDVDMTSSVLRLSPRIKHGGQRRRIGGNVLEQPTCNRHQVKMAWDGSAKPLTTDTQRERKFELMANRSEQEQQTDSGLSAYATGRRKNIKLVYLKDTGEMTTDRQRNGYIRQRIVHCLSGDEESSASSGDDTANSISTKGTLSPADALTISRYSSRAMSSSYLSSATSTTSRRNTSAGSSGNNMTSLYEIDATPEDNDESQSDYFTPAASGDDVTTFNGSSDMSAIGQDVNNYGWRNPDCGTGPRQNGAPAVSGQHRIRLRSDGVIGSKEQQLNGGKGGTNGDDKSGEKALNTARTCSNELLNVISIDDDKLRYRHSNSNNNNYNNSNINKMLVNVSSRKNTLLGHRASMANRRRVSSFGKPLTAKKMVSIPSTTTSDRKKLLPDGNRRQPSIRTDVDVIDAQRQSSRKISFNRQDITTASSSSSLRIRDRRPGSDLNGHHSTSTWDCNSPTRGIGSQTFLEMNRALRQVVENVWAEERCRSLYVMLGADTEKTTAAARQRVRGSVDSGGNCVIRGSGRRCRQHSGKNEYELKTRLSSTASDCSIYCKTI